MNFLQKILYMIPGVLIALTVHEFAHAKVADKLGDKTPRFQGRLTLNPSAHIDPIGFILFILLGIGWAKPVQVNPSAFKNYYKDDLKVSLAGPLANLIAAFIAGIVYAILLAMSILDVADGATISVIIVMVQYTIMINVTLFVFNLLPLPGLDGFSILRDLRPKNFYEIAENLYRYQVVILIGIIVLGGPILRIPIQFITSIILKAISLVLGIIV